MFTINQPCIFGKCCCTKKFLGTFISFRTFQLNKQTEGGNNQSHITNEDNINWSRNQIHDPTLEPGIYLQRSIFWNHQFVIFYYNSPNWSLNLQCRLWRRSLPKAQLLGTDATSSLYFLMQDSESFCTFKNVSARLQGNRTWSTSLDFHRTKGMCYNYFGKSKESEAISNSSKSDLFSEWSQSDGCVSYRQVCFAEIILSKC